MGMRQDPRVRHRLPQRSNPRLKVVISLVSAVSITGLAAYGAWQKGSAEAGSPATNVPPTVVVATPLPPLPGSAAIPSVPPGNDVLLASFDELAQQVGAEIGLAYAPLDHPEQAISLGSWSHGPAWSTIKVPLALALLRDGGNVTSAVRSAITASDNSAAESIWEQLGGGAVAARKVQDVLAEAGDPLTEVPSERRRSGFSVFGQTDWSVADQARFLARVACDPDAAPVTGLMGEIVPGQQWGLGAIDDAYFKGGWGPGTDGLYLVRQFGVVPTGKGRVAVAIAAVAASGGFGDGAAVLDRLTGWLQDHLYEVGGGRCPSG